MQFAHNAVRHALRARLRCAPAAGNRPPARSEHRGYMYADPGALPVSAFFGQMRQKKTAPLAPVQSQKPCGLNPVGGVYCSNGSASAFHFHLNRSIGRSQGEIFQPCGRSLWQPLYVVVFPIDTRIFFGAGGKGVALQRAARCIARRPQAGRDPCRRTEKRTPSEVGRRGRPAPPALFS